MLVSSIGNGKSYAREFLDILPQLRVRQHVIALHFGRVNTLELQHLNGSPRETAFGEIGGSLHEKNDGFGIYCFLYLRTRLLREQAFVRDKATGN